MVFQSDIQYRRRRTLLNAGFIAMLFGVLLLGFSDQAFADATQAKEYLRSAQTLYKDGQYFKAARYAFSAAQEDRLLRDEAYPWVTLGLIRAGLYHSASYFFIQTLATKNQESIRRVLTRSQDLIEHVGLDLLREHLVTFTSLDDYDSANKSTYLYAMGKKELLRGNEREAIRYLDQVAPSSSLRPYALMMKGTAHAIIGADNQALDDFRDCTKLADAAVDRLESKDSTSGNRWLKQMQKQAEDLAIRCIAGEARTLYQMKRYQDADRVYGRIPKQSFVWTDILFEQAWNAFALSEYNRTLGKLVTYRSPALGFVFNSEIDVLAAQSYLALCLYEDANKVINDFNREYGKVGVEVKRFLESNKRGLVPYYNLGSRVLKEKLHSKDDFNRLLNRFVRGSYFQNLVQSEKEIMTEWDAIRKFDSMQSGVSHNLSEGFPGFLQQVLSWRRKTIELLGGAYVKNSLLDYYSQLLSDFEKMSFIKLEMLRRAKEKLISAGKKDEDERSRGSVEPSRRGDQYYWSFNGEFWSDEIGDYVFGLESECR